MEGGYTKDFYTDPIWITVYVVSVVGDSWDPINVGQHYDVTLVRAAYSQQLGDIVNPLSGTLITFLSRTHDLGPF